MRFYKELTRINGTFQVVNPSPSVLTVLQLTRVDKFLVATGGQTTQVAPRERSTRRFDHQEVGFEVFDLDERATLVCRTIGTPRPLAGGAFEEEHCSSFEKAMPAFALGIGAFGESFPDCRARFGEMLSVGGATAYQPADGTNVADYLRGHGWSRRRHPRAVLPRVRGPFSHLVRFETLQPGGAAGLSRLLAGCFEAASCDTLGVVVVAEAAGLVGAALRRSPAERIDADGFFAHPGVRTRLTFTAERRFLAAWCWPPAWSPATVERRAGGGSSYGRSARIARAISMPPRSASVRCEKARSISERL